MALGIDDQNDAEIGIWHLVTSMMDYADKNSLVFEKLVSKSNEAQAQSDVLQSPNQPSESMVRAATAAIAAHNAMMPIDDEQSTAFTEARNLMTSVRDYAQENGLDFDHLVSEVGEMRPEWAGMKRTI